MTIKSMQRQLLDIADRIPNDILLNLLKSFAQILTRDPEPTPKTPFIRAFAKIRGDNAEKQFSAIIEEDEDNHVISHEENRFKRDSLSISSSSNSDDDRNNEGENECSFNYKVANVVTQEVIYSMNGNEQSDDQESTSAAAAIVEESHNGEQQKDETNGDQMVDNGTDNETAIVEENLLNENHDAIIIENGTAAAAATTEESGSDAIDEGIEVEMPKPTDGTSDNSSGSSKVIDDDAREVENDFEEISKETIIDEMSKSGIIENGEIINDESHDGQEECEVEPIPKVSLDDIQREIQEMQMFIKYKNAEETIVNQKIRAPITRKNIEDAYKVDVCVNLKKKHEKNGDSHHHKKQSKSKAILANYLNGKAKEYMPKERPPIFDPTVPNTPEDFMKEKSVSEKINKKKQKIKNLDVNWQRLVDSQKKVYKHSNFKAADNGNSVEQQKSVFN